MKKTTTNARTWLVAATTGLVIGVLGTLTLNYGGNGENNSDATSERKPLYWQAPMNPDFRSDKPGKSPMGMDLIPVYADDDSGPDYTAPFAQSAMSNTTKTVWSISTPGSRAGWNNYRLNPPVIRSRWANHFMPCTPQNW